MIRRLRGVLIFARVGEDDARPPKICDGVCNNQPIFIIMIRKLRGVFFFALVGENDARPPKVCEAVCNSQALFALMNRGLRCVLSFARVGENDARPPKVCEAVCNRQALFMMNRGASLRRFDASDWRIEPWRCVGGLRAVGNSERPVAVCWSWIRH